MPPTKRPSPEQLSVAQDAVEKFAKKFSKHARRRGVELWDLRQAGLLAAIQAHERYDESRSQWITHLYTPVRYAMLRELLKLGTPLKVHRDAYELGESVHAVEYEDIQSDGRSTLWQECATECRELLVHMEELAGPEGARVLAASLVGAVMTSEASDLLGMSETDFRAARSWVVGELRKRR